MGSIKSVSRVAVTAPPTTTVARGICSSAPVPRENSRGVTPSTVVRVVMITGRRLSG